MIYFSATTNGFYNNEINELMPADALEISDELWLGMVAGQDQFNIISSDVDGYPILKDISETVLISNNLAKETSWVYSELKKADLMIDIAQDDGSQSLENLWRTYRKSLRSWEGSADFPEASKRPKLNQQ